MRDSDEQWNQAIVSNDQEYYLFYYKYEKRKMLNDEGE